MNPAAMLSHGKRMPVHGLPESQKVKVDQRGSVEAIAQYGIASP